MRTALLALAFPFVASLAQAQVIQLEFTGGPSGQLEAGQAIARRMAMRAWQDSVQILAEEAAAREPGVRITGPTSGRVSYLLSVVAVPVAKPGYSGVAMAVVVFEPATLVPWRYFGHFVSVTESAPEAAISIVESALGVIRRRR